MQFQIQTTDDCHYLSLSHSLAYVYASMLID